VSQLLKNIMYIGKIRYKEEIHEGEHEAIIDLDTWNEVQAQLKLGDRMPDQPYCTQQMKASQPHKYSECPG